MRGRDGKLYSSEKERGKLWKDYMERIMKMANDWNHAENDPLGEMH